MGTLYRFQMRQILEYLDNALAYTRKAETCGESNASWNIRMARQRLLEVAIAAVEVEQVPADQAAAEQPETA